jgi:hypothetical protein
MAFDPRGKMRAGCSAMALLAAVALPVTCAFEMGYLPVRSFDAELWRKSTRYADTARVEMVDSLIWSGRLDGLTRSEVEELLGPPGTAGYFRDWDMVYRLGDERGLFPVDSEWLVIRIGSGGRVSEYRIERD